MVIRREGERLRLRIYILRRTKSAGFGSEYRGHYLGVWCIGAGIGTILASGAHLSVTHRARVLGSG
jgi:hypothetical protein